MDQRKLNDLEKKDKIYNLDMFDKSLHELIEYFLDVGRYDLASSWISSRKMMYVSSKYIGIENEDRAIKVENVMNQWDEQSKRCNQQLRKDIGLNEK